MNVVVITTDTYVPDEHKIIDALFNAGLQRLHIRKPRLTAPETCHFIKTISEEHREKLVIHHHHELYTEMGLGGIHLSSIDRDSSETLALLNGVPAKALSASLHSWAELDRLRVACSYVFISPVFDSISKPGYTASINMDELMSITTQQAAGAIPLPKVYGLGGVNAANIGILSQKGFDGAAVLGAVWQSPDPVAAFREIMAAAGREH